MPPQIPSPVIVGGGGRGGGRGLSEALLLGLVTQAPGAIFDVLRLRREGQREASAGEASQAILGSLFEAGTFGPELESALQAAGGQIQPGLPGGEAPAAGIAAPVTVQPTERRIDVSGIEPRSATDLLQQFLATQQGVSGIQAEEALTRQREAVTELTGVQTQGAQIQNRTNEIRAQIAEATQGVQERLPQAQLDRAEAQTAGELARADRLRRELDQIETAQESRIIEGAEELVNEDFEQFRRWTATLGQIGLVADPQAAAQQASMMVFGQARPPSRNEWRQQKRAVLQGEAPGPSEEQERTRLAGQIGLEPQLQQIIDQAIVQFDSPEEAWGAYSKRIRENRDMSDEEKAQRLLTGGLYMEGITGADLGVRKEISAKEKSILKKLFEGLGGLGGGAGSQIFTPSGALAPSEGGTEAPSAEDLLRRTQGFGGGGGFR